MTKRENGEGSISWDKVRHKYRAAIIDTNGKRLYKRFDSREEAKLWLNELKSQFMKNEYVLPTNITLGEWILEWLETFKQDLKISTKYEYLYRCKYIEPIAHTPLQELTSFTVQKFINDLSTSNKREKVYILLYSVAKKAYRIGLISKNFMVAVERPKSKTKKINIYTTKELHQIFRYLKSVDTPKKFNKIYVPILLAVTTGIRLGELLALRWENVDLVKGTIRIVSTIKYISNVGVIESSPKTAAGKRIITLPVEVINELKKLYYVDGNVIHLQEKTGYVFHTRNGTAYLDENFIHQYWKPIVINAGVEYKNFHVLRHTHATQLLASGVPLLEVSKRLGHSKASHTLDLYGHAIPELDKNIAKQVSKIYTL